MPGINLVDTGMSQPELDDFQKVSGVFEQISAVWPINANITGREKPERVEANAVSTNYFTMWARTPALGRVFNAGDSREGFSEAAVISDSLWHKMFGGDPESTGYSLPSGYRPVHNRRGDAARVSPSGAHASARRRGLGRCRICRGAFSQASGSHAAIYSRRHRALEVRA